MITFNLPMCKGKETGKFGMIKINMNFSNVHFDNKLSIEQGISRFLSSKKQILVSKTRIITSLNSSEEYVSFQPEYPQNEIMDIRTCFDKNNRGYHLSGLLGNYYYKGEVTADIYEKAKSKIVEMNDPDYEYNLDEYFDLFSGCGIPELEEWPIKWCSEYAEKLRSRRKIRSYHTRK